VLVERDRAVLAHEGVELELKLEQVQVLGLERGRAREALGDDADHAAAKEAWGGDDEGSEGSAADHQQLVRLDEDAEAPATPRESAEHRAEAHRSTAHP